MPLVCLSPQSVEIDGPAQYVELSRVPVVGEEIFHAGRVLLVKGVRHVADPVRGGNEAFVVVQLVTDPDLVTV